MSRVQSWLCVALALLLCLTAQGPTAAAPELAGKVVGVIDGDTLDLLTADRAMVRVRLAEIDAPEHDQPWGSRAKQALSDLAFGRQATVHAVTTDRYGRTVGRVFVAGTDVNAALVAGGAAWAYRAYLTDASIVTREAQARAAARGLWSLPVFDRSPPWEWRKGLRATAVSGAPTTTSTSTSLRPASAVTRTAKSVRSCDSRRYCRQMTSCADAVFHLRQCGIPSLDGDGDGVPCESLCQAR